MSFSITLSFYTTKQGISRVIMSPMELKIQNTFAKLTWILRFDLQNIEHS
jgi:hypothetical protein